MNGENYVDKAELRLEMEKWRLSADRPEDRVPSERLGQLLMVMHDRILGHRDFREYRRDIKEEMMSFSLFRILKRGLATYDPARGSPFSYFTRTIFQNYVTVLRRYYRRVNNHQKFVKGVLAQIDTKGDPKLEWLVDHFGISG